MTNPTVREWLDALNADSFRVPEDLRTDAIDAAVRAAVEDVMRQRTQHLLNALDAGHDGVDFVPYAATQGHALDPETPLTIREQVRPWRGGPPEEYPDGVTHVDRVDFREHDRDDLRDRLEAELDRLEETDA